MKWGKKHVNEIQRCDRKREEGREDELKKESGARMFAKQLRRRKRERYRKWKNFPEDVIVRF